MVSTRDIDVQLGTHLIEVRGQDREAVFEILGKDCQPTGEHKVIKYDMLHVTPPQGPLDVVAQSELANADGWVDVDAEVSLPPFPMFHRPCQRFAASGSVWDSQPILCMLAVAVVDACCAANIRDLQHDPQHGGSLANSCMIVDHGLQH